MPLITKKQALDFLICGTILAMVFSPFFLTLGFLLLAGLSLVDWKNRDSKLHFFFDRQALVRLAHWRDHPALIAFTALFFIVLLGVWGLSDFDYWVDRLFMRLPFLLLPLLFIALPPLRERDVRAYLYFLLVLVFATSVVVVANYLIQAEAIHEAIKRGQSIPMPRNHIRFSLLMALAIIGGGYLTAVRYRFRLKADRWLIPTMSIGLFIFMHILAVRTGLLALYAALFVLGLRYALVRKNYWALASVLGAIVVLPVLAYQFVPSLHAKIDYVRWDFLQHQQGSGGDYADSGRIASLQTGWALFQEQPLLGTGSGSLRPAVAEHFAEHYPQYPHPLMPHNQYLYVAAGTGLIGFLVFVGAFFFPLFYRGNYRYPPILGLYTILAVIFLIEHTLENSLGAGYAAFFLMIFLASRETGDE